MTWTGFFEGIQSFFEGVAFAPFNALRELEATNWWIANSMILDFYDNLFFSNCLLDCTT